MDRTCQARDYLKDPKAIYQASFAAIREEARLGTLPITLQPVAVRLIHACGMPDIVDDLFFHENAAERGRGALVDGRPILADATMVAAGIISRHLPADNAVICTLNDERTSAIAKDLGTTRSAAAVDLWRPHLENAIVAIGNAPTALFRLLELLDEGAPQPAVILGFPVGFIGAAESKQALIEHPSAPPYIALRGRRGGSALAAAAVNALAIGEG
ncbi:MAG: precorrin-8X methylmutase [Geminicoccaceae bacterium]